VKVYVSGPMTGIEQFNHPAFANACEILRLAGYEAESPHWAPELESWEAYMRHDLALLLRCDAIAMLPGWEHSRGARLERLVAEALGLPVWYIDECRIIPASLYVV
jgi:hypothetical protein